MTEEGVDLSLSYRGEIWRKALHLLSLAIPVGLLILGRTTALYILVPIAAILVLSEVLRSRSQTVRDLIWKGFGFMMRPEEIPPAPAPLRFNGATWVLLGACVVVSLFEPSAAAAAMVIGLIGDAAAALVGRRFGRRPIGRRGKSLEGTIAFAVAALPAAAFVPGPSLTGLVAAVIIAALVEGFGTPINDNLAVPLAAGIVLTLL
ncbi:MAG TPA: phosphatidate cytidylyltransferase [Rhodothermia bacterium]